MANLNAHEAGNGGKKPRGCLQPTKSPLLGEVQSQWIRRSTLKKHNNSGKKGEPTTKRVKSRGPDEQAFAVWWCDFDQISRDAAECQGAAQPFLMLPIDLRDSP